jgi:hypothetical protein
VDAEANKAPEVEVVDPKKKGGKDVKKETAAVKKEAPKKDAKKKDVKLGEPIRETESTKQYNRNNYGLAAFFLTDLLRPNVRSTKL